MNTAIIVDINTNEGEISIQEVNKTKNGELIPIDKLNQVELMSALCEGICMLIHSANNSGLKKDYKSVEDCISHIKNGFADTFYFTKIIGG